MEVDGQLGVGEIVSLVSARSKMFVSADMWMMFLEKLYLYLFTLPPEQTVPNVAPHVTPT